MGGRRGLQRTEKEHWAIWEEHQERVGLQKDRHLRVQGAEKSGKWGEKL